jgi:hypothetical protein
VADIQVLSTVECSKGGDIIMKMIVGSTEMLYDEKALKRYDSRVIASYVATHAVSGGQDNPYKVELVGVERDQVRQGGAQGNSLHHDVGREEGSCAEWS